MSVTSMLRQYTTALTLTNDAMYPDLIDQVHREVPYLWFMSNRARAGGLLFENGGTKLKFDIIHAQNTNSKAYYGFDTLNPSPSEEITAGFEPWRSNAQMIALSLDEILENYGEEGIIKIAPAKYQVALMSMYNDVHRQLVKGIIGVTGTNPTRRHQAADKELLPLGYLIQKEFSNADRIHEIDQTVDTYFQNQRLLSTAPTRDLFRQEVRTISHDMSEGSTNDAADLGLCTQAYYELLEASVDDRRRYVNEVDANIQFEHIVLGPTMFLMDYQVPDFGATATDTVGLTQSAARAACIFINTNWMQLVVHEMAYFMPTPWIEAQNMTAIFSKIILKASHRVTQRRKQGLHYGVNASAIVL